MIDIGVGDEPKISREAHPDNLPSTRDTIPLPVLRSNPPSVLVSCLRCLRLSDHYSDYNFHMNFRRALVEK